MRTPQVARLLGVLALLAAFVLSGLAGAQANAEVVERIHVEIVVGREGRLAVVETIDYVFPAPRRGIVRRIPERDASRRYRVSGVEVTTSAGTPGATRVTSEGGYRVVRIGDANRTVTGRHRYVVAYTVEGALTRFADHDELYWNAVGAEWAVPVGSATVTVRAGADVTAARCLAGRPGSTAPCRGVVREVARQASFGHDRLAAGEALTVVVGLPRGYASRVGPVTETPAVATDAPAAAAAAGVLVLGTGGVLLLVRRGRDLRWSGQVPGLEPGAGADARVEPAPVGGGPEAPVEWLPPDVAPAIAGALLDQRFAPRHVSATVADLAVRGHVRFEPEPDATGDPGWRLHAVSTGDALTPVERHVLGALFDGQPSTTLTAVGRRFGADLPGIEDRVWEEVVSQRWFAERPDRVRKRWNRRAWRLLAAALVAAAVVAWMTPYDLAGAALVPPAVLLVALRGRMPVRTATGSAALARLSGFRRYLATAEADEIAARDRAGEFARYLPWAIVFGVESRWASTLDRLGVSPAATGWAPQEVSFAELASATAGISYGFPGSPGSSAAHSSDSSSSPAESGFSSGATAGGGAGGGGGSSW